MSVSMLVGLEGLPSHKPCIHELNGGTKYSEILTSCTSTWKYNKGSIESDLLQAQVFSNANTIYKNSSEIKQIFSRQTLKR